MAAYRFAFIIEQALGHITHAKNLQANVPRDPEVEAYWGLIPWETRGLAAKLPLYRSNWTVRAGLRARRAIAALNRQTRLDALFIHTQTPAVLAADWLRRMPSIVSLDATPLQYDALGQFYDHAHGPAWLENLKWRLNRDCFRAADRLVAWTAWTKAGLAADYGVPPDKVTVIPPGVNPGWWARPQPRQRGASPVKILFVGGNLQRKGGLDLLAAFRALRATRAASAPALELHLATRDALPAEPGVTVYRDMQPNSERLRALYHDCDIFCLPTYGDCLPMVLSEAGAAGLPCVSTRIAGIPEIVREGETGFLIAPGDTPALAQALGRLADHPDLRLEMGQRGTRIVSQHFDAEKNALQLLALLKDTVAVARRRKGDTAHG